MANDCYTEYCFHGTDLEKVDEFRSDLTALFFDGSDHSYHHRWQGRLLELVGEDAENYSTRGWVEYIDNSCHKEGDEVCFYLTVDDAWAPHQEVFEKYLEKKYPGGEIEFCYLAEEPGMGVYINTDLGGCFFPDRFIFDDWNSESYGRFEDEESLILFYNEKYREDLEPLKTLEEVIDDIRRENEKEHHISLNEYEPE